jgi:hypothetical protein
MRELFRRNGAERVQSAGGLIFWVMSQAGQRGNPASGEGRRRARLRRGNFVLVLVVVLDLLAVKKTERARRRERDAEQRPEFRTSLCCCRPVP